MSTIAACVAESNRHAAAPRKAIFFSKQLTGTSNYRTVLAYVQEKFLQKIAFVAFILHEVFLL